MSPSSEQFSSVQSALSRIASGRLERHALSLSQVADGVSSCYHNAASLLSDAQLLWENSRHSRALSLTILALEELAKIPDLHDQYLRENTRIDPIAWNEFWGRFTQHKSKQKRIVAYGNIFSRGAKDPSAADSSWSPFAHFLSADVVASLDIVKQRGFYVDYVSPRFLVPQSSKDVVVAFSDLYAFAEERLYAFGTWHITPQRSSDFLSTSIAATGQDPHAARVALQLLGTFNDWATSFNDEEVMADLLRAFSYFSAGIIPDYDLFIPTCENIVRHIPIEKKAPILNQVVSTLRHSFERPCSPTHAERATKMFKLAIGHSATFLSGSEFEQVFGFPLSDRVRDHFSIS
jgi:AbiV family abortive infection protein